MLSNLLTRVKPNQYWETHAGAARYRLSHSARRECGVPHFERLAAKSKVLASSDYYPLLKYYMSGNLPMYPGSPSVAMSLLRSRTQYLFCDTDCRSLRDIESTAHDMGIGPSLIEVARRDGISVVGTRVSCLSDTEAREVFTFIDPYWPLESKPGGMTSVELLSRLTDRGCRAVLWYGCTDEARVDEIGSAFAKLGLSGQEYAHFGIQFGGRQDEFVRAQVGLRRFGLVCGNIDVSWVDACQALSVEMAKYDIVGVNDDREETVRLRISTYAEGRAFGRAASQRSVSVPQQLRKQSKRQDLALPM